MSSRRDKHRTVDDRPYGGGPGMLMKVQPLRDAIHAAKAAAGDDEVKVIYLSPQGRRLDHNGVQELATRKRLILVAGRYEGIDERLIETEIDEEWSLGDFVLSGGELPAMDHDRCGFSAGARCAWGIRIRLAEDSFS